MALSKPMENLLLQMNHLADVLVISLPDFTPTIGIPETYKDFVVPNLVAPA